METTNENNETQTIWIKGSCDSFKEKKLFKCICKVDGDKLILGEPFVKGSFSKEKFKDNCEEKPFNYIIAINTYEKVLGRGNRFEDFYNLFRELKGRLEKEFNVEVKGDFSSDYERLYFRVNTGKIEEEISLDINRESITKIKLRVDNFRDKTEKVFLDSEFEDFKEYLNNSVEGIINSYKEKVKVNPYLEEVRKLVGELESEENKENYRLRAYNRDFGDYITFDLKFDSYKIPIKFNDSITDHSNSFQYAIKFENDSFKLVNFCYNPKKEIEEIKTIQGLREFFNKEITEAKGKAKVSEKDAREEINRLKEQYEKENCLTTEKLQEIMKSFKVGDKVTLYGVSGMFGNIEFEGKIARINESELAVIHKGGRTRGIIVRKGDGFKEIKQGYNLK